MTVSNNKDKLRWLINDDEEYESIVTRDEHSEKSNKNYDSTFLSKKIDEICENFLATNNFNVKTKNSYFNSIEEILLLLCKNVYNFVDVVGQLTVKKKINAVKDSNLLRFDIDASPLYKRDVFKFDTTCYTIPIKEDITKYLNDSVHLDENETQLSLALFLDEFNVSPLGSYKLINIKSLKYLQSSTKKHFRSICVVQSVIASQNWEKFLSFICKQINFSVLINGIERYISLKFIVADNVGFADIYKIVKNYKSSCKQQNCKSCLWKGIEWSSKRTPNDISINLRKHSISYLPPNSNMCNDPFHDLLSNGVLYTATMLTLKNMLLLLPPLMSTDEIKNKLILEAKNRKFRNLRLVLFDKIFSKLTTTKRTSKAKNESHDVKSVNKCVNLNGNQTLSLGIVVFFVLKNTNFIQGVQ
uniref:Mab-21 domain-containing protein n=1 Tax=Strongyloides papillosus TaxID=174720 RepID=A0A0N5BLS8_STREA